MNKLIYTDYDVRPDLLTAEERAQFPETLSNEDRRTILSITRPRMDNVDYDGHNILTPDEWVKAYTRYANDFRPDDKIPALRESITRDVVNPQTGEVVQVDAGLADIVQRMMDRGLVIDSQNTCSAMITDHPGMRWMHDDNADDMLYKYPAGTHIYGNLESERPHIVFPIDNTAKHYNNESTIEAIREAARLTGFHVMEYENHARPQKALTIELPYLMDGTSYNTFLDEVKRHAETNTTARFSTDRQGWRIQINNSKLHVADSHGGVALYSDNMILDIVSRFERAIQRLMVSDKRLAQRSQDNMVYSDFLTAEQDEKIERQTTQRLRNLSNERALPYAYQRYKDSPERVDEIARMAGYTNYLAYISSGKSTNTDEIKRWSTFQKLEKEHLHTDHEGVLKLFRIHNGINRDVNRWANEERQKLAAPVMQSYRQAGYPVDKLQFWALLSHSEDNVELIADVNGKTIRKQINDDCMSRLKGNAITPFEVALETCAEELGWRGRLIVPVSRDAVEHLSLEEKDGTGMMPLKQGDRIYKVAEEVWRQGVAMSQYENMPKSLQKALLEIIFPRRTSIRELSPDEIWKRVTSVRGMVDEAVYNMELVSMRDGEVGIKCKIDGVQQMTDKFTQKEFDSRKPLPVDNPKILTKELLASRHINEVFMVDWQKSMKR